MHCKLSEACSHKILILDGAMGTMIQQRGLAEAHFRGELFAGVDVPQRGNYDLLNLTMPHVVAQIHAEYLEAGADIISTNTFSSQSISQADYHMEHHCRAMALAGAQVARRVADRYSTAQWPRFVAGSVGPTGKSCSISPDVCSPAMRAISFDHLHQAYLEQIEALLQGGVDALLIETAFDTLNAKAALSAAMQAMEQCHTHVPLMLSATLSDMAGRTLSGQTLDALMASVMDYPLFSIGLNCSFGASQMVPYIRQMARKAPWYVSAHPNAGLPNAMGQYDDTPQAMAQQMAPLVDDRLANIIGGCCGTTQHHIRLLAQLAQGHQPRVPAPRPTTLTLSGLEPLSVETQTGFVVIGERCNVAGSRRFLRLIKEKRYAEAVAIAIKQVDDGAMAIDINMDDGMLDAQAEMTTFVNMLASEPSAARVPLMIDSSCWQVVLAGLKCAQGKCIVNSISLKEGEDVFLSHARDVKAFGAAVVVMCFDEQGQATTYERRIAIASRAYRLLTHRVGMSPTNIIIDPNVLAIATGIDSHANQGASFIRSVAWIRSHLPGVHVSGGVSNLSFAFRGNDYLRQAIHAVFLYHATRAGMDMGIVNPSASVAYGEIPSHQLQVIEDAVLCRRPDSAELLMQLASSLNAPTAVLATPAAINQQWRTLPVGERLATALVMGQDSHLQADVDEALAQYPSAVSIVEGPLMHGMATVGELFGCGKMFLPQVVKAARTMKQAVTLLQPHIQAQKKQHSAKAGRVLLATVKGDVHDIGKNIVAVVMACNNYEVIDMGVMVPAEQIARKAIEVGADIVGLSGLITPSLEEMVNVARCLKQAGLSIPIMIGGATTSEMHVALKIAPVYGGAVVWVKDASQNSLVAARLLSPQGGKQYIEQLHDRYSQLRAQYHKEQTPLLSIDQARRLKPTPGNEP